MRGRHPVARAARPLRTLPTRWLMTDERQGEGLWRALERLPRGGGVIFRHYATPAIERRRLFDRVRRVAQRRGLIVVRAGERRMRGEQGVHARRGGGIVTWPAHDRREAVRGVRAGADLLFVSPLFGTRSHPGAKAIGPLRAASIARRPGVPVIALGGMDERRWRRARGLGFAGFAAIDAWGK